MTQYKLTPHEKHIPSRFTIYNIHKNKLITNQKAGLADKDSIEIKIFLK